MTGVQTCALPIFLLAMGTLLSLMLSVIAWFIRQLHQDFRNVQIKVTALQHTAHLIQSESRLANELLKLKLTFLQERMEKEQGKQQMVKPLKRTSI